MLIAPAREVALSDLREQIATLEGSQRRHARTISVASKIDEALPGHGLSLGCIHELKGSPASTITFAGLLSSRIERRGAVFFIEPERTLYPLGLLPYGIDLRRWIHVRAKRQKDLAWAVLEALRCPQVDAVMAVMASADLTFSRRLQLAAESSGATGFFFGNAASAITRWRISAIKNSAWSIELTYCRGGRPGKWNAAWRNGCLEPLQLPRPAQREQLVVAETALAG